MTKTDTNDKILFFKTKKTLSKQTYAEPFYLASKNVCLGARKNIQHPWLHQQCLQMFLFFPVRMINQFIFLPIYRKLIQGFFFSFSLSLFFFFNAVESPKRHKNNSTQKFRTQYTHFKFVLPLAPEHASKHKA